MLVTVVAAAVSSCLFAAVVAVDDACRSEVEVLFMADVQCSVVFSQLTCTEVPVMLDAASLVDHMIPIHQRRPTRRLVSLARCPPCQQSSHSANDTTGPLTQGSEGVFVDCAVIWSTHT